MKDMHSGDAALVATWFTEESELWIPPATPVKGLSRIRALFRAIFGKYDFLTWNIVDILPVSAVRCVYISESHGKMKGRNEYRNRIITDISFNAEGKITNLSDYFKDTSIFSGK